MRHFAVRYLALSGPKGPKIPGFGAGNSRPWADGAVLLHHGRIPAWGEAIERSGHQISDPRRLFERLPGVRLLADVRNLRLDQAARDRRGDLLARPLGSGRVPHDGDDFNRAAL